MPNMIFSIPNAQDVPFDNSTNGYVADNVQEAIEEGVSTALDTPVYTIVLTWNGTISNGEFYGYSNLLPGDDTPITIPIDCEFVAFSWSNRKSGADYTLDFRKNSTGATVFLSESRTNTQNFSFELTTPEPFSAGDEIYIEHGDDGTNASDVGLVLAFRAVPT